MKATILGPLFFISVLLSSCGSKPKKTSEFSYERTKTEEKKAYTIPPKTPVDLKNDGLGPIKRFDFDSEIDSAMAAEGEQVFGQYCTACHMEDAKLIGPAMVGIYERRSPAWVMNMILNPTQMLKEDPTAKALLEEYNNVLMLNQNLSETQVRALAEYFRTL